MEESESSLDIDLRPDVSVAWISQKDVHIKRPRSLQLGENDDLRDNIVYIYFEKKKIRMLFDFMVQHLMINEPDNPIEYLKDLLDKLLMWRSGTVSKAPQLFEERHVEAIYRALDPAELDVISLEQYHNGFKTLNLDNYILYPNLNDDGLVEKHVFMKNSLSALDKHLMEIVKPTYTTLCELTILPDESYDVLFQDYSTEFKSSYRTSEHLAKDDKSLRSCRSSESCVILREQPPPVSEDRVSATSDASYISEYEASISELDNYDFLLKTTFDDGSNRRGTVPGSKITMISGKTGGNARELLSEELGLGSSTVEEMVPSQ